MTSLREAATQALEALEQSETFVPYEGFGMARREAERKHQAAITALRAALAEPVQEPVANDDEVICPACCHQFRAIPPNVQQMLLDAGFEPPFTTPPQRPAEPTEPVAWMMVNPTHPRLSKSLHWTPQTDWHATWKSVPLYAAPIERNFCSRCGKRTNDIHTCTPP